MEIALARQSCRSYDSDREVENEKIEAILEAARLAPSACNGQPYHFTVCKGETVKKIAGAVTGMGINKFAADVPVMIVISEEEYVKTAVANGLEVFGFSDHAPFYFIGDYVSGCRMEMDKIDFYFDTLLALREKYKEHIDIKIGFEIEY